MTALALREVTLAERGSGSPPAPDAHASVTPACRFCTQILFDLGCNQLFCVRCKVFQGLPAKLRWETAGVNKVSSGRTPWWLTGPGGFLGNQTSDIPPLFFKTVGKFCEHGQPAPSGAGLSADSCVSGPSFFKPGFLDEEGGNSPEMEDERPQRESKLNRGRLNHQGRRPLLSLGRPSSPEDGVSPKGRGPTSPGKVETPPPPQGDRRGPRKNRQGGVSPGLGQRKHNVSRPKRAGRRQLKDSCPETVSMLRGMAETLKACTAQDPLLQQQAIALGEWVEREGLPEETLESQVAWQVMEHCSGTPGALDLPTLGAFLHIAAETYQPGLPTPLRVTVANVTKWRQDILKWFQHVQDEVLLAQETHLSLEQEKQAKTALRAAGYHSFWSGATDTNLTKGGVVVATKWHAHPRLVHAFTTEGCGFVAVELPRVHWRLVLISVYLRSGVPLQVEPNSTILAELLTVVKNIPTWIAAGDFNIDVKKCHSFRKHP